MAMDYLENGELDRVLWGICDLGVPDYAREAGAVTGEGAGGVVFLLLAAASAGGQPAASYGRLVREDDGIFHGELRVEALKPLVVNCLKRGSEIG